MRPEGGCLGLGTEALDVKPSKDVGSVPKLESLSWLPVQHKVLVASCYYAPRLVTAPHFLDWLISYFT